MSLLETALLLASIGVVVIASPISGTSLSGLPPVSKRDWTQIKCSDPDIADAGASPAVRWEAASAGDAWNAVMLAWNQEGLPAGDTQGTLNFSAYVGNFFHTKEEMACENMAENPCDDTIACVDVSPAGYIPSNLKSDSQS
jgi:hypothetical protein